MRAAFAILTKQLNQLLSFVIRQWCCHMRMSSDAVTVAFIQHSALKLTPDPPVDTLLLYFHPSIPYPSSRDHNVVSQP